METIDENEILITTPVQAEKHYKEDFLKNRIDLGQIKKELKDNHGFSEEDIRITSRVLSNAKMKHEKEGSAMSSHNVVRISVGIALIAGGSIFTVWLWHTGWVASAPVIGILGGFYMLFKH